MSRSSPPRAGADRIPSRERCRGNSSASVSSSASGSRRMLRLSKCRLVRPAIRCTGVASHTAPSAGTSGERRPLRHWQGAGAAYCGNPSQRAVQARHPSGSVRLVAEARRDARLPAQSRLGSRRDPMMRRMERRAPAARYRSRMTMTISRTGAIVASHEVHFGKQLASEPGARLLAGGAADRRRARALELHRVRRPVDHRLAAGAVRSLQDPSTYRRFLISSLKSCCSAPASGSASRRRTSGRRSPHGASGWK